MAVGLLRREVCLRAKGGDREATEIEGKREKEGTMERTGFVGMVTRKAVKRNVAVCVAEPRRNLVDLKVFGRQFELPGRVVLLSVPFMWGSFGPAVRYLYSVEHAPSPAIFNAERVVLAAAVMFWSAYNSFKEEQTREGKKKNFTWVAAGFELGAYIFLSTITQVVGLRHVEASRAAFLNQLQTVFVPILAFATGMERKIPLRTCISSLVAVAGLSFLASDHTVSPNHGHSSCCGASL